MNITFVVSCSCGKHDFIFGQEPDRKIEVKCPECEQVTTYDPSGGSENVKEAESNAGKTKQK